MSKKEKIPKDIQKLVDLVEEYTKHDVFDGTPTIIADKQKRTIMKECAEIVDEKYKSIIIA